MTQQHIPEQFIYGNIVYEISYTIAGTTAEVVARPAAIPESTGAPYSFDISHGAFIFHDRLAAEEENSTVFVSALTTFLNNHVTL